MRKVWPDAFAVAVLIAVLFSLGWWLSAWGSELPPPPERKIDLRAERAIFLHWLRLENENVAPPTPLSDAKCAARFGPGAFATGERGEGYWCITVERQPIGALDMICALRWPDSEAALLVLPEMMLFCRVKGKAV